MPAGTITLTNNSTAVTGAGTAFPTELKANDFLVAVVGGTTYTLGVKSVESATALTLAAPYGGPTTGALAWTPIPNGTLVGITAQIAADTARAIRGLNYDKQNWQQVYSASGNITVILPDGSTYTGPSWKYLSDNMATATLTALAALVGAANKLPYFTDTDKMAVADLSVFMRGILGKTSAATARQSLELAEASTREVGTGANQIPDMSSFSALLAVQGHAKEPSGLIRQWTGGNVGGIPAGGSVVVTFPFPFPNELLAVVPCIGSQQAGFEAAVGVQWVNRSQIVLHNSSMTKSVTDCGYIAYGR